MHILRDVTGDNWESMQYLANIYLNHARPSFEKIAAAIQNRDAVTLQSAAHGCAGSSASFGAETLSLMLHELEMMGKQANMTQAGPKLEECRCEFERVVSYLNHLFQQKLAA